MLHYTEPIQTDLIYWSRSLSSSLARSATIVRSTVTWLTEGERREEEKIIIYKKNYKTVCLAS